MAKHSCDINKNMPFYHFYTILDKLINYIYLPFVLVYKIIKYVFE